MIIAEKIKTASDSFRKRLQDVNIIIRYYPVFLYLFYFSIMMIILWQARGLGLLGMPVEGMDQLTMVQAAINLCDGELPPAGYMYSPAYTVFLAIMVFITGGDLVMMRIIQAAICAMIPVMIFEMCIIIKLGYKTSIISSLIYCLYAPAALISLDFLRAGPLALCFLLTCYLLFKAFLQRSLGNYFMSGLFAGLCILGRENFIPVVALPFLCLLIPAVKRQIKGAFIIAYMLGVASMVFPVASYNYIAHDSFSIIPGAFNNIMGVFYGKETVSAGGRQFFDKIIYNIPVQCNKFISSYEIPNSLSVYAHKELVGSLNILFIPFNLLLALALPSIFMAGYRYGILVIIIAISAYAGSIIYFDMLYRYRIPCVPLICCVAGAGLSYIFTRKKISEAMLLLAGIAVFYYSTYKDHDSMRTVQERTSVANVMIDKGLYEEAKSYLSNMSASGIDVISLRQKLDYSSKMHSMNGEKKKDEGLKK